MATSYVMYIHISICIYIKIILTYVVSIQHIICFFIIIMLLLLILIIICIIIIANYFINIIIIIIIIILLLYIILLSLCFYYYHHYYIYTYIHHIPHLIHGLAYFELASIVVFPIFCGRWMDVSSRLSRLSGHVPIPMPAMQHPSPLGETKRPFGTAVEVKKWGYDQQKW